MWLRYVIVLGVRQAGCSCVRSSAAEDPAKMIFKCILAFTILIVIIFAVWQWPRSNGAALGTPVRVYDDPSIAFMGVVLSIMWTPHISEWISKPLSSLYDGGD